MEWNGTCDTFFDILNGLLLRPIGSSKKKLHTNRTVEAKINIPQILRQPYSMKQRFWLASSNVQAYMNLPRVPRQKQEKYRYFGCCHHYHSYQSIIYQPLTCHILRCLDHILCHSLFSLFSASFSHAYRSLIK